MHAISLGNGINPQWDNDGKLTVEDPDTGVEQPIFQIALASFNNLQGLLAVEDNAFQESPASGSVTINTIPGESLGTVSANFYEGSNVDILRESNKTLLLERYLQAKYSLVQANANMFDKFMQSVGS